MKLKDRINKLSKENNFANNMNNYFFSTLWLSSKMLKIKKDRLHEFMLQIIYPFYKRKYPGISFSYLMIDDSLREDIKNILIRNGMDTTLLELKDYKKINIADKLIISVHSILSIIHKHLVININMLQSNFSQIDVLYLEDTSYKKEFNKYYIEKSVSYIDEFASSSRASLLATYNYEGGGYIISDALILDKMNENIKYEEVEKRMIDVKNIPNISSLNILTGNGFSKYLTSKYLKDSWLVKQKLFTSFIPEFNERLKEVKANQIENIVNRNNLNLDKKIRNKLKSYFDYEHEKQIKYINSSKIIIDYITYAERFSTIQANIFRKIKNGEINSINDESFYDMLDKMNIIGFDHKKRKTLFHSFIYVHPEDFFSNIECSLTIIDKFTNRNMQQINISKNISEEEIEAKLLNKQVDIHRVLNYVYPEVYIEHVWNYRKINSLNWNNKKINAKKVFTLNYDNITDKVFGKSIHLHGSFEEIYEWKDENVNFLGKNELYFKTIALKNDRYFNQIFPNRQSLVLKGGDYKMEHIFRVTSKNGDSLINSIKELSYQDGDFLVIGTLIIGDPHIIDLLGNKERTIYITYYDKSEFNKLYSLLLLSKITRRKSNYKFVDFKLLMNYLKI